MRGLVRVCTCVGAEAFAPYMAAILAPVLHSAALEDACVLRDEGENKSPLEGKKGYEVIKMDLRAVGEQYVCINTAMLEEKALAVELLFEYATALGVVFLPYLQPCVELVTPMLRYPYHEEVRQASCRALPAFMGVAQKVARQLQSISPDQLAQMFEFMAGPFLEAIEKENLLDALEEELEMFALLLKEFALPLSAQAVERVNAVVASITGACLQRRQFRKEQEKENEDMDEEGLAELEAENGKEDDMLTSLYAVVGQVCKNCRESYFVPFTKTLLPVFKPLLGHSGAAVPDGLVLPAMFIIDDVLEYCSTLAQASLYVPWFFPIVKKLCKSENVDLRHSAAFGVGSCAKALGPMFREAKAALETLTAIIRAPGSREGEDEPATDDAISSVGKICRYSLEKDSKMQEGVFNFWLSCLPLKADVEEAQVAHANLVYFVREENKWALNKLPQVLTIFAQVLNSELVLPETKEQMVAIWQALPAPVAVNVWANLRPEARQILGVHRAI